jgi:hypothetical protein
LDIQGACHPVGAGLETARDVTRRPPIDRCQVGAEAKVWAEDIERTATGWRAIEKPQEWTAEEVAKLRKMYGDKCRLKVIAKTLRRTVRAVDNKLVRIGLRPRISRTYEEIIWTPEQIDELRKLCADARLSAGDIAAQVGKPATRSGKISVSDRWPGSRQQSQGTAGHKPRAYPAIPAEDRSW